MVGALKERWLQRSGADANEGGRGLGTELLEADQLSILWQCFGEPLRVELAKIPLVAAGHVQIVDSVTPRVGRDALPDKVEDLTVPGIDAADGRRLLSLLAVEDQVVANRVLGDELLESTVRLIKGLGAVDGKAGIAQRGLEGWTSCGR